jgi:hypothetical protein
MHVQSEEHCLHGQFYPEDMPKPTSFCCTHNFPGCDCIYQLSGEIAHGGMLVKNLSVALFYSCDDRPQAILEKNAAAALLCLKARVMTVIV